MPRLIKVSVICVAFVMAISLALLSVFIEQVGPEWVQYGDSDYRPVLKGGFPVAYLYDAPGISVERQLAFVEDKLVAGAFILDIAVYFVIALPTLSLISRRRFSR